MAFEVGRNVLWERHGHEVMSAEPGPIRILAVDDHALIREGIAGLVAGQSDMSLVAQASNGREAIHQFRTHRPDITLMDLQMPEMNGVDAMIAIRGEFPEARIIVLTTYTGDVQVLRALKADARTPAEVRVLRLIAEGNANKEIAAQLSVSEETVKGQVRNILSKLGAND